MGRKITTAEKEYAYRIIELRNKIVYIKQNNKEIEISHDSKFIKNLMSLSNEEFDNLLMVLMVLAMIYRDVKLKKKRFYNLWEMKLKVKEHALNILILILKNQYLNKKAVIIINLFNTEKQIIICDIDDINNLETII